MSSVCGDKTSATIKDTLQYKPRPDLEVFVEGELETIFIETTNTNKNTVVGSIYSPPNTNIALSIQRFENIFNTLKDSNTIIGNTMVTMIKLSEVSVMMWLLLLRFQELRLLKHQR